MGKTVKVLPDLKIQCKMVKVPNPLENLPPPYGVKGPSPELAWSPPKSYLTVCVYMWERTVKGISVHTAETEMAKTPY